MCVCVCVRVCVFLTKSCMFLYLGTSLMICSVKRYAQIRERDKQRQTGRPTSRQPVKRERESICNIALVSLQGSVITTIMEFAMKYFIVPQLNGECDVFC